jgi:hypothetical protein
MSRKLNIDAIVQAAIQGTDSALVKQAAATESMTVPLAQELQKVANLLRSQSAVPDVTNEDVLSFAKNLMGRKDG